MNFWQGLTLVFIALKLTNYIDWGWFYILLPFIGWVIIASIYNTFEGGRI